MLILSRKQDDTIMIGEDIEIKVIAIEKGAVKLGFSAPERFVILRGELKAMIASQNQQASQNDFNPAFYPQFHSMIKTRKIPKGYK